MLAQSEFQLFVGLNDGDTGLPIEDVVVDRALNGAIKRLSAEFGGCTVANAVGAWGEVRENTVVITVITEHENAHNILRAVATFLKRKLNQQAILLTVRPVATELI